jgi:hypothetical protein
MSVKPFSPSDAKKAKLNNIPKEVIESFNELLAEKIDNYGFATLKQNEVIKRIQSKLSISSRDIFDKNYLDIEDIYRAEGWKVEYEKGAYYETFEPYFTFSKQK